ncbi:MAG: DUF4138 domain-containing protein [Bacteroidota bacterium]|nr:DUF4138 domain-containing protein [Bacteroidota bacterium]MDP4256284.1 DUF4138 domain-containing protein [Bacteroidota bacterium]
MRFLVNFFLDGFMLLFFGSAIHGQPTDPRLSAIRAIQVPVTVNKMTSLIFPAAIRSGIRASRDVLVQRVKGTDNALELKALKRHFVPTNLSVYAVDGRLYSFTLQYADDPPELSFVVGGGLARDAELLKQSKPFVHHSVSEQEIRLSLTGIYLADGLMWMVMQVRNSSPISYSIDHFRMYTAVRKAFKRHAIQELPIEPVFQDAPLNVPTACLKTFVMAVPMFTPGKNRRLVIELEEKGAGRLLRLQCKGRILYKAISK